ncbi:hypothetical protein D9M72_429020 [compost metagenome]
MRAAGQRHAPARQRRQRADLRAARHRQDGIRAPAGARGRLRAVRGGLPGPRRQQPVGQGPLPLAAGVAGLPARACPYRAAVRRGGRRLPRQRSRADEPVRPGRHARLGQRQGLGQPDARAEPGAGDLDLQLDPADRPGLPAPFPVPPGAEDPAAAGAREHHPQAPGRAGCQRRLYHRAGRAQDADAGTGAVGRALRRAGTARRGRAGGSADPAPAGTRRPRHGAAPRGRGAAGGHALPAGEPAPGNPLRGGQDRRRAARAPARHAVLLRPARHRQDRAGRAYRGRAGPAADDPPRLRPDEQICGRDRAADRRHVCARRRGWGGAAAGRGRQLHAEPPAGGAQL